MKQLGLTKALVRVDAYGLTGSGVLFRNSCLKLLIKVKLNNFKSYTLVF